WIDIYPLSERPGALKEAVSPLSKAKLPLEEAQKPPREGKYPLQEARHLLRGCFLLPGLDTFLLSEAPNAPGGAFSPTLKAKSPLAKAHKSQPERENILPKRRKHRFKRLFSFHGKRFH